MIERDGQTYMNLFPRKPYPGQQGAVRVYKTLIKLSRGTFNCSIDLIVLPKNSPFVNSCRMMVVDHWPASGGRKALATESR